MSTEPGTKSSVDFALLAPVPAEHLKSGEAVATDQGYVAFGSLKWELFKQIDGWRGHDRVPVLIYPSYDDDPNFEIRWVGWYVDYVDSVGGAHPYGMKHRPPTTAAYANDTTWAVYWHVEELRRLDETEYRPISSLESYKTGLWRKGQAPRGPEIVARPDWI